MPRLYRGGWSRPLWPVLLMIACCWVITVSALVALELSRAPDGTPGLETLAARLGFRGEVTSAEQAGSGSVPVRPEDLGEGVPEGFVAVTVEEVVGSESSHVVLLKTRGGDVFLPIWIGASEALAIHLRLGRQKAPRPLTHDLFESTLSGLDAQVLKMHIHALRDSVFQGTLFVQQGERTVAMDSRPSDSIALAVGAGAPIYVSRAVLDEAGIDGAELLDAVRSGGVGEGGEGGGAGSQTRQVPGFGRGRTL